MFSLFSNLLILFVLVISVLFLFSKKLRTSDTWHALVIPLASVRGSGFLISAPLLILLTGIWAPVIMVVIMVVAYALGDALRFNINNVEPIISSSDPNRFILIIEDISKFTLGLSYIIAVAFYLKILSAFAVRGFQVQNELLESILATIILLCLGIVGNIRGLSGLQVIETFSVNLKLATIFSIIAGHFTYNLNLLINNSWTVNISPHQNFESSFRMVLGLLVIIQGFEISRYIGHKYSAKIRVSTMRHSQILTGFIYISFVALSLPLFNNIHHINETTSLDLCKLISPILPPLLIAAAIMSQLSAAIADTIGGGGLLHEASKGKLPSNLNYLLLLIISSLLIWMTNIYEIISIASKAFALYYIFQLCLTFFLAGKEKYSYLRQFLVIILVVIMILVLFLSIPIKN